MKPGTAGSGGRILFAAAMGITSLTGCATRLPVAPTVAAMPAQGESFAVFQQHDATCRQYASAQVGGATPGRAAAGNGLAGAAVGTGVGAASGALIGSASGHAGPGAAIGAGAGLLAGALAGSSSGRQAAAQVQGRYNIAYSQCMVANGEQISQPYAPPRLVYVAPPPGVVYVQPPPVVVLPP